MPVVHEHSDATQLIRNQDLRTTRSQLTDVLLKLADARAARNDNRAKPGEDPAIAQTKSTMRGMLNDRLRFLGHQARFLAAKLPGQVAQIEYSLIGLSYEDVGDLSQARASQLEALDAAQNDKERAYALRALGRLDVAAGNIAQGRAQLAKAIGMVEALTPTDTDATWQLAQLFRTAAQLEIDVSEGAAAKKLLERGLSAVSRLSPTPATKELSAALKEMQARDGPPRASAPALPSAVSGQMTSRTP
jgi:tetratricopeptide (TPR) repeat protein